MYFSSLVVKLDMLRADRRAPTTNKKFIMTARPTSNVPRATVLRLEGTLSCLFFVVNTRQDGPSLEFAALS